LNVDTGMIFAVIRVQIYQGTLYNFMTIHHGQDDLNHGVNSLKS